MKLLRYRHVSLLLAFVIGVAITFVTQSWLRPISRLAVSQPQPPVPQSTPLPPPCETEPRPEEAPPVESPPDAPPPRNLSLLFSKYSVSEKAEGFYENAADYPQLAVSTTAKARRFNRYVEDLIRSRIEDASTQGRNLIRELQRKGERARTVGALTTSYEILSATQDFVSISFTHSYYWTFHPIDSYESVNYDLTTGESLQLRDIFKPKAKYLHALSKLSRAWLVKLLGYSGPDSWMIEGTGPLEKNFKAWNITPGGLVLSFDNYQIGPNGSGAPSITIPLIELKSLLKSRWLHW